MTRKQLAERANAAGLDAQPIDHRTGPAVYWGGYGLAEAPSNCVVMIDGQPYTAKQAEQIILCTEKY